MEPSAELQSDVWNYKRGVSFLVRTDEYNRSPFYLRIRALYPMYNGPVWRRHIKQLLSYNMYVRLEV